MKKYLTITATIEIDDEDNTINDFDDCLDDYDRIGRPINGLKDEGWDVHMAMLSEEPPEIDCEEEDDEEDGEEENFDFKKEFPSTYIAEEHINKIKSLTRVQAIKYIKENGQGFDNPKLAAIYYDEYIKPCL